MYPNSHVRRADWDAYLAYLGGWWEPDALARCVHRAYIDFKRTLYGIGRLGYGSAFQADMERGLCQVIADAAGEVDDLAEPEEFDAWHRRQCLRLVALYEQAGYCQGDRRLHIGQAQKWLNMAIKYVYALGPERMLDLGPLYPVAHVPLDNILLDRLAHYGFPPLGCRWSRLDDYDLYLDRQRWIRRHFAPLPPLDAEFHLWLRGELPRSDSLDAGGEIASQRSADQAAART